MLNMHIKLQFSTIHIIMLKSSTRFIITREHPGLSQMFGSKMTLRVSLFPDVYSSLESETFHSSFFPTFFPFRLGYYH